MYRRSDLKKWLMVTGLLLTIIITGSMTACQTNKASTSQQPIKVTTGNLTITVSGSGTIELSHEANLAFGLSGKVEKIPVKEGDKVQQGDIVAKMETDALELSLSQAKVAYAQAQMALMQDTIAVGQAETALTQAEIARQSAVIALDQTSTNSVSDIKVAQAQLDAAKRNLDDSLLWLKSYTPGTPGYISYEKDVVAVAQARVTATQNQLDALLNGFSVDEVSVKQKQVMAATQALATTNQSLTLARLNSDVGKQSLDLAAQSRDYAQTQLDKATIKAPFSGTIATLPVDEGDTVLGTTLIARLIEPDKLELKVQVDEIDIPGVKIGQRAIIKVDALPDTQLDGKVSFISLLPIQEAGVTLFDVKIEITDTKGTGLKGGMSASADIVTSERDNVLLVPARAVKLNSKGESIVTVSVSGKNQERTVVTGMTDGFQTEITSGLKDEETIVESP
jgi:HlyD family secretion protein